MKKLLKIIHTISAIGLSAAFILHLVILIHLPSPSLETEYSSLRQQIAWISNIPMISCLAIVLVSGLFSMALHTPFHNSGWVWVKAALGLLLFEWVLIGVSAPAQKAYALMSSPEFDLSTDGPILMEIERQELGSLSIMLIIVGINIVLAIWRPRLKKKNKKSV